MKPKSEESRRYYAHQEQVEKNWERLRQQAVPLDLVLDRKRKKDMLARRAKSFRTRRAKGQEEGQQAVLT